MGTIRVVGEGLRVVGEREIKDGITMGRLSYLDTREKSDVFVYRVHCTCRLHLRN